MDKHTPEQRRRNMQAVKSKGSKIEQALAKELWSKGLRYRKNVKSVFGTPDFVFIGLKIAVFCDSEFFHGKNWETKKLEIKSNQAFWIKKIEGNMARDAEVNTKLIEDDWAVIRFWGKDILKNPEKCADTVRKIYEKRKAI